MKAGRADKAGRSLQAKPEPRRQQLHTAESAAQVRALLDAGADVNALDEDGFQPLHLRAILRRPAVVKLLLEHGGDVNGRITDSRETPLMVAAGYGLLTTVRLLLSAGASVEQEDAYGQTALAHAVAGVLAQDVRPRPEVIQELLRAGAHITPEVMWEAGSQSSPKIVQLLLDAGADVNASTGGGWTALSSAVSMGNTRVAKLLLQAGADPNCMVYQQTALAAALQAGHTGIAKLLKAAGATDDPSDKR